MKKYKVQLTPRARRSITHIISYLQEEQSKSAAQHVRRGIMDKIKSLNNLPASHEIFEEISAEQQVYHKTLQWKYKIVFTVDDDVLQVVVVQVYHGHRGDRWINSQFT
ncbi:MAG: hypothetical protein DA408_19095 [Bacteroidetes bacterium]|nr:MAG: hypothetical protein DA408_19095 [Bacteroidota bacterium]